MGTEEEIKGIRLQLVKGDKFTGRISFSHEDKDGLLKIIVNGKIYSWEDIGRLISAYDGCDLNFSVKNVNQNKYYNSKHIQRHRDDTQKLSPEIKEKVHKIAYYLSKYEHDGIFDEKLNQGDTIQKIADKLGVKASTLKNKRDSFDPYCSKKRIGWVQAALSADMKYVYDYFENKSWEQIRQEIIEILAKSAWKTVTAGSKYSPGIHITKPIRLWERWK